MMTNFPRRTRNLRYLVTSWFALVVLGLAGCGGGPQPAKFNDEMVKHNKRLARASWEFREAFYPLMSGGQIDLDKIQRAYDNVLKTVKDIQEEWKKTEAHRSTAGADLHKAYDIFLASQRRLVEQELAAIVVILKRVGAPVQNRIEDINKELTKVGEKEGNDLEKLRIAQNKFGDELSIRLTAK